MTEKELEEEAKRAGKCIPFHVQFIHSCDPESLIPLLVADNDLQTPAETPQ